MFLNFMKLDQFGYLSLTVGFFPVTGQTLRLLVPVTQARKVFNRKRFLEEYERTVNNFTGRLDAKAVTCDQ